MNEKATQEHPAPKNSPIDLTENINGESTDVAEALSLIAQAQCLNDQAYELLQRKLQPQETP